MTKQPTVKPGRPAIQPVTFSPHLIRRHHKQLTDWLAANGIDPATIPTTHPIRVEQADDGPVVRFHAVARDDSSTVQGGSVGPDEVGTTECTAPCTVPPPDLDTPAARRGTEADE